MTSQHEGIEIVQWNCQSIRLKVPEIEFRRKDIDIFAISETRLKLNDPLFIKGYDVIRRDRIDHPGGGVAILINNKLKYQILANLYNCQGHLEMCAIELQCQNPKLIIVSVYRAPDKHIQTNTWARFFTQFIGKRFIILGDFNAHNSLWGDRRDCTEGRNIVDAIDGLDINVLNNGGMTFLSQQYGTETAIDISFVDSASHLDCNWRVNDELWGSDHYPILIDYNNVLGATGKIHKTNRLYSKKTNWLKFEEDVENRLK